MALMAALNPPPPRKRPIEKKETFPTLANVLFMWEPITLNKIQMYNIDRQSL